MAGGAWATEKYFGVVEAVLFNHYRSRDMQRLLPNEKAQRGAVRSTYRALG